MSYIKTTSAVTTTLVSSQDGSRTYSITKALENAEGENFDNYNIVRYDK